MPTPLVIADLVLTMDGHTTGPAGPYDMSCIAPHGVSTQARDHLIEMTEAPVILLGRASYEGYFGYWPHVADDPDAEPRDRTFARWLCDVEKVVFSRTLTELTWTNSRLATGEPADVVAELRATASGDIRVPSSMSIIRQLLRADAVDVLEIAWAPSISGGGGRLFDADTPASSWATGRVVPTDSGAVRVEYRRDRSRA